MAKRQRRRRQQRQGHARREGWTTCHSVITGAAITAGGMLGVAQPALADDFTVNSTADNGDGTCQDVVTGDCTLRDAIYDANSDSNYSSIHFASSVTGTITLNGDELPISYPVYIYGPGPNVLTVSGDDSSRIFDVVMAAGYSGYPVGIYGLTLSHGYTGGDGGAIYNYDATLRISNASLTANHAYFDGGALFDRGSSPSSGYNNLVSYSTVSGNTAGNDGGGLYGYESLGTIGTSTVTGNQANSGGGIGGGVSSFLPPFVYSSTVTGNSARYAGGFANLNGDGYLYNSIVANNTAPGEDPDLGHAFYAGFDLIRTPDTATLDTPPIPPRAGPNITGQDPQLGPLQNNGGSTLTLRQAATSPVVDQGLSYIGADQRGVQRPIDIPGRSNAPGGDGGDMGSVELTQAEATIPPAPVVPHKKKKKCKKKKKHHSAASAKKKKCKKKKKHAASAAGASASPWRQAAERWAREDHPAVRSHHAFRAYRG
jgi:CSLREA domain-containing protein